MKHSDNALPASLVTLVATVLGVGPTRRARWGGTSMAITNDRDNSERQGGSRR